MFPSPSGQNYDQNQVKKPFLVKNSDEIESNNGRPVLHLVHYLYFNSLGIDDSLCTGNVFWKPKCKIKK